MTAIAHLKIIHIQAYVFFSFLRKRVQDVFYQVVKSGHEKGLFWASRRGGENPIQ